ncbi:hypothetical protein [Nocardioides jiangxiensis]|uniref:DUF8017 domain-containing protein n=1 Tax=Nocardioides jiangxiensis TaxID=3064524 RepID=A0ABT9B1I6_9ACTN|nr:hypothetical protein [Nocardioides sp. WY-20]MDO7868716.1 hypothetical protein [Nocardioides sp. WY-20]
MTLRRSALVTAVVAVVVTGVLVFVAADAGRHGEGTAARVQPTAPAAGSPEAHPSVGTRVPPRWVRVRVGDASYAVPRTWQRRPAAERTAYREGGAVIAAGRGQALSWGNDCRTDFAPVPGGWAVLPDPVAATDAAGVAAATAVAWARGYAGLPATKTLAASPAREVRLAGGGRGLVAQVTVDTTDSANPCAGQRAELTAVARQAGGRVVTLVVARYLDVRGAPGDAVYAAVLGSLRVG